MYFISPSCQKILLSVRMLAALRRGSLVLLHVGHLLGVPWLCQLRCSTVWRISVLVFGCNRNCPFYDTTAGGCFLAGLACSGTGWKVALGPKERLALGLLPYCLVYICCCLSLFILSCFAFMDLASTLYAQICLLVHRLRPGRLGNEAMYVCMLIRAGRTNQMPTAHGSTYPSDASSEPI